MPTPPPATGQADGNVLLALLDIEERARNCATERELAFLIANETHRLVPYRQAILLSASGAVKALSGVATVDRDVPFLQWFKRNIAKKAVDATGATRLNPEDLPKEEAELWSKWLPPSVTVFPVVSPAGVRCGTLIIGRREPVEEGVAPLLDRLLACYGHAWSAIIGPQKRTHLPKTSNIALGAGLCVLLLMVFLRVDITVLAPAEIVPLDPVVVRAPLDGVVDRLFVEPNEKVSANQILFKMDTRNLEGELAISRKALETLVAQYTQLSRKAVSDPKSKAQLPIVAGKAKEQEAGIRRLEERIERSTVRAQAPGIVIVDNVTDWAGKPVRIGERVLMIADESHVEIEAWLPVSEVIDLPRGAPVKMFLNSDPLDPVLGQLRLFSYEAQPRPDGVLAHRIRATPTPGPPPRRIGLRGTARLTGGDVSLAYWIFRKPISKLRQFAGF